MMTIRATTFIQRPIADVYTYLGCYENDIHWRTGVIKMKQSVRGIAQTGMYTQEVVRFMGYQAMTTAEVTAAELNRRTAFQVIDGPVKAWEQRHFEKRRNGTHFTYELTVGTTGFLKVLSPIIRLLYQRQMANDLSILKQKLERNELVHMELA
ncbi:hypothetical protein GCM10028805_17040 [Spirosoma harenae]